MATSDAMDATERLFAGESEMAARGRAMDWAATPLGSVDAWPQTLRTAVRAMIAAPVAMSLWCGPTYTLLYNDGYRRILGVKHPDALGHSGADVWAELWPALEPQFRGVCEQGIAVYADEALLTLDRLEDGREEDAWFTYSLSPLTDDEGACIAVLNVAVEITERVRARREEERLLTESEEGRVSLAAANDQLQQNAIALEEQAEQLDAERARAERILEAMTDAHFVVDSDFRFESVNQSMERNVGMPRAAMLGHSMWELFPGLERSEFERHYRAVMTTRVEAHFTNDYADDRLRLVTEVDAYPADGGGIAVFWRDVSARARADAALRASELQLRSLADAIPTLAWTARPDGYIDWFNARWYEYTGATPADMEGSGWHSVHDPRLLPAILERWHAAMAVGAAAELTFPLRGADGSYRRFLTRFTPVRDEAGQVVRWFGTNTDVETERAAREAAEHANQAKTDFLATMSHELRTPLNAIAGYAELLTLGIHGPVTDAQREALSRIQRSQRHLLGLINDVLNFAKLEAGQVEFDVVDVRVRNVVDTIEPLIAPQLLAKQLNFSSAGTIDESLVVRADPDKVQQILINLLSNAIKFTGAGGCIGVRAMVQGDVVHIVVEDSGMGVVPDRLEQIFAPFVQVDRRLNAPHEGTGLGLAISRDLARGMGGELSVESTVGVGSRFTLTLPGR